MKQVTPKERQVLQLIAEGKSSKEIAIYLSISFHTVETHRKHLRSKFEARNIAEVITKAYHLLTYPTI
jgi:DNA-binding CsgD family transcriptional regulator